MVHTEQFPNPMLGLELKSVAVLITVLKFLIEQHFFC